MNKKITIAGGGSTYTPGIVKGILNRRDQLPVGEICLYDIDAMRNENMELIINHMLEISGWSDVVLTRTEDPEVAFTDSDFVFSQIRVGGLKMREQDEKIPLSHGLIGQETCGLGGFAYGLRTIGGILELVGDIQEYAPEAWILNYTNPETIVAEAIRREYPDAKMINACDMTISLEETIADNFGYNRKAWIPTYFGLNHFGWYTEIYDKDLQRDVMPEILEKMQEEQLDVAYFNAGDSGWAQTYKNMQTMVTYFPDHLPNNYLEYYLIPDVVLEHTDKDYTRANQVMDGRSKKTDRMAQRLKDGETDSILDFEFGEHGEYIVDIATSILEDRNDRFMLIEPNNGSIPNLRADAVVEVPCYVGARGVEKVALEPINDFHKGMMEAQVASEKLLVDAYFEGSYLKALQAFTLNQTVPSASVAKVVLDEMIEANKEYWPELT